MTMQTKLTFVAVACATLCTWASAQSCATPPGTVGIGTYCKAKPAAPAQVAAATLPATPAVIAPATAPATPPAVATIAQANTNAANTTSAVAAPVAGTGTQPAAITPTGGAAQPSDASSPASSMASGVAPVLVAVPAPPEPPIFDVTSKDSTVRDVLVRWSAAAGWTHAASHWTINRDFPIAGTADASVFGADFKEATRRLLSSTELTDRPVQPCFYTNKILRVVPKAELCDKTAATN
jgi:hypothetical protein